MSLLNRKNLDESWDYLTTYRKINVNKLPNSPNKDSYIDSVLSDYKNQKNIFNPLETLKINSKRKVYIANDNNKILLHAISNSFKKIFSLKPPNRNINIKVLKNIFNSGNSLTIMKFDIKKHFDNIPHDLLLEKIGKNRLLNTEDLILIENYLKCNPNSNTGVHQGTQLSNLLAELFLINFDSELITLDKSLIFAKRYVDDILLVFNKNFTKNEIMLIYKKISNELNNLELEFNHNKTQIISLCFFNPGNNLKLLPKKSIFNNCNPGMSHIISYHVDSNNNFHKHTRDKVEMNYLGYRFNWKSDNRENDKHHFNFYIDISPKKLNKHKTRVYKMFNDFIKKQTSIEYNKNYFVLRERIRFLCSNYILPKHSNKNNHIIVGISPNYKYIHDNKQVVDLIKKIKRKIFYLYKSNIIDVHQMKELMLITIQHGKHIDFVNCDENTLTKLVRLVSDEEITIDNINSPNAKRKYLTYHYLKSIKLW